MKIKPMLISNQPQLTSPLSRKVEVDEVASSASVNVDGIAEMSKEGRPTCNECRHVVEEFGKLHPAVVKECQKGDHGSLGGSCGTQKCPLDGLVSTTLSQNATNANSSRAFQQLKEVFRTGQWQTNFLTHQQS